MENSVTVLIPADRANAWGITDQVGMLRLPEAELHLRPKKQYRVRHAGQAQHTDPTKVLLPTHDVCAVSPPPPPATAVLLSGLWCTAQNQAELARVNYIQNRGPALTVSFHSGVVLAFNHFR